MKNRSWKMKSLSKNCISSVQNHKKTKMFCLKVTILPTVLDGINNMLKNMDTYLCFIF